MLNKLQTLPDNSEATPSPSGGTKASNIVPENIVHNHANFSLL